MNEAIDIIYAQINGAIVLNSLLLLVCLVRSCLSSFSYNRYYFHLNEPLVDTIALRRKKKKKKQHNEMTQERIYARPLPANLISFFFSFLLFSFLYISSTDAISFQTYFVFHLFICLHWIGFCCSDVVCWCVLTGLVSFWLDFFFFLFFILVDDWL